MKINTLAFVAISSLAFPFIVQAGELEATSVVRSVGDSRDNQYISGYTAPEKGNLGSMPASNIKPAANGKLPNLWKSYVVFDGAPMIEELAQKPTGELEIAVNWIKSADDVKDVRVIYIGAFPSIEIKDGVWYERYSKPGTEIGVIPAHELAAVKSQKKFTFSIDEKIPSGDVTPVNRYLVFRFEADPADDPEANGTVGLSPKAADHKLKLGDSAGEGDANSGGYL